MAVSPITGSHIVRAKSRESDETLHSSDEIAFLLSQSLPSVVRFDQCRDRWLRHRYIVLCLYINMLYLSSH